MYSLDECSSKASNQYSLNGKVAIITGASRGIGKAISLIFAKNGARLVLVARNEKRLQELKAEIDQSNEAAKCHILACDLHNIKKLIDEINNKIGDSGPDILINNAGTFALDDINNNNNETWQEMMNVQLTASYELSRYAARHMINKKWGRLLNVSSISAEGEKYAVSYSTAKAGLIGLTRAMALELAQYGITVNAICPGWVETEMAVSQLQDADWCEMHDIDPKESVEIARLSIPQKRILEPVEIAHLAAFLCSQEAAGITGQSINICGGLSLS